MSRITPSVALFLAALFVAVMPAAAFEIFGIKFFEDDEEDAGDIALIDPLSYDAALILTPDTPNVRREIERASKLLRDQDRPALGRAGLLSSANGDYGNVLSALYKTGHYGGTVSILINGREASELPLDVALSGTVGIAIRVTPGPIYNFKTVSVKNAPQGLDSPEYGLIAGAAANSDAIGDTAFAAVEAWREAGHARARVNNVDVTADHASRTVDASIDIDPSILVRYGRVTPEGTREIDPEFITYMVDLRLGRVYSSAEIADARRRLLKLDTFSRVAITEADDLNPDGTLDFTVELEDRAPRRIGTGVSVSSIDGLGVEGFWLHRNLFGRAERLRFDASVSRIGRSIDPGDYNWDVGVSFIRPGTISPDTDFQLTASAERELADNYDARALSLSAGLVTVINEELSYDAAFVLERSFTRDDLGERDFITYGIKAGATYDTRDDPLDAKSGYYIDLEAFPFREVEFGNTGLRTTAELRAYRTLDEDGRFTLAGRAKLGSLIGVPSDEAPNSSLFFSGGGGSVRGFAFRSNGVDIGTDTVGGRSLIEFSTELRTELTDAWGVVGFVDAGIVSASETPDFSIDPSVGVGIGVRYKTGIGPIRLDLARGLDRASDDPVIGIYIGLGQAF
jgi:translocation and assembly module TamA